jgi:sarcosine oxidase
VPIDIIIAGLGAVGSAAAWQLAGRGARVLGLDRYHPPHSLGSSHGGSRVIRESAFEHLRYVPLARRAFAIWRRLERDSGQALLHGSGVLFLGPADAPIIAGTVSSAAAHDVPCETLSTAQLARRYPEFRGLDGIVGVLEPGAGWIDPERAVTACLRLATRGEADLHFDEPLLEWEPDGTGVAVVTSRARYRARRLLLAAGPWMPSLLGVHGHGLSVERQVQHWFAPADAATARGLPVFIRQSPEGVFYALPPAAVDGTVKVAVHHDGAATDPETVRRAVAPEEIAATQALLARYVPALAGEHRRATVCLYTNARDGHFVIDHHPDHRAVVVASPCNGFGFKFASALGEILADLLLDRPAAVDLTPFRLQR